MGGYWSSSSSKSNSSIPSAERRVLIALDGSAGAQKAFNFWANVPGSQRDELILYSTLEVPNTLTGLLLSQSGTYEYEEREMQANQVLLRAKKLEELMLTQCRERRLRCKFVGEVSSSPGAAIVEASRRLGANIVVVGCRGNNGIRRTILGSVSDYVLQHSGRPIVVVPARSE